MENASINMIEMERGTSKYGKTVKENASNYLKNVMESVDMHSVKKIENASVWTMITTSKNAMKNAGKETRNAMENVISIDVKRKVDHVKNSVLGMTVGTRFTTVYATVNAPP